MEPEGFNPAARQQNPYKTLPSFCGVCRGRTQGVQTPLPPECSSRTQNNSSPRKKCLHKSSPFPFSLEPPASLPQLHSWHTSPGMASEVSGAGWSISCSDSPAWDANFLFLHSRKGHRVLPGLLLLTLPTGVIAASCSPAVACLRVSFISVSPAELYRLRNLGLGVILCLIWFASKGKNLYGAGRKGEQC